MSSIRADADVPPSGELLFCCARGQADAEMVARLLTVAEDDSGWARLWIAARDHGVAPLVFRHLEASAGEAVPPSWRERFRSEYALNARRNLFLSAELLRVLSALEGRGVRATPHKGPVLAAQAYGDVALRQITDLDIVVPQSEIVAAHDALASLGFRYESTRLSAPQVSQRIPGQYAYCSRELGTQVELHTEATLRYVPGGLDLEPLLARRETFAMGGCNIRVFSIEDTLILLSVHGAKHFWSRLGWICDIARLAQIPRGVDWELSERLASRMRCRRMWLLGLALANEVLHAPLPRPVLRWIRSDPGVAVLCQRVHGQLSRRSQSDLGLPQRLSFRVRSHETIAQGFRQCIRVATRPTEEDWTAYPLPGWLEPLYAVLRPWRLLRTHGFAPRVEALPDPGDPLSHLSDPSRKSPTLQHPK